MLRARVNHKYDRHVNENKNDRHSLLITLLTASHAAALHHDFANYKRYAPGNSKAMMERLLIPVVKKLR